MEAVSRAQRGWQICFIKSFKVRCCCLLRPYRSGENVEKGLIGERLSGAIFCQGKSAVFFRSSLHTTCRGSLKVPFLAKAKCLNAQFRVWCKTPWQWYRMLRTRFFCSPTPNPNPKAKPNSCRLMPTEPLRGLRTEMILWSCEFWSNTNLIEWTSNWLSIHDANWMWKVFGIDPGV